MDEVTGEAAGGRAARRMELETGGRRFPILDLRPESCLIEAPDSALLRGFADIWDGERHVARCLILLAAPEGALVRCSFKRRTAVRAVPPPDFAP